MSNADLIDLALCGGYVYEEDICDCCGHDNSRWVLAEMPVYGCQRREYYVMAQLHKMVEDSLHDMARKAVDRMMQDDKRNFSRIEVGL